MFVYCMLLDEDELNKKMKSLGMTVYNSCEICPPAVLKYKWLDQRTGLYDSLRNLYFAFHPSKFLGEKSGVG